MPDIRPFHGLIFNPEKVNDLSRVVTEPYDIINPLAQKAYYQAHPYNIIRLILGRRYPTDTKRNNQYTRAKKFLQDWQKQGILVPDKKENIYVYNQSFWHNNERMTRTGLVALLKLEDFAKNTILPHENTFAYPVQDRLKLLEQTRANLSPIFALFCDQQGRVNRILSQCKKSQAPFIRIEKEGIRHSLWRLNDNREIAILKKALKQSRIFIADGHHRYEAALSYKMLMRKRCARLKGFKPFDYVMAYLTATNAPGLTILPTHRVVKIKGPFKLQRILFCLKKNFTLRRFFNSEALFKYLGLSQGALTKFGVYFGKNKIYALTAKGVVNKEGLGVTILHSVIIKSIAGVAAIGPDFFYTRDAQEAIVLVNKGKYQAAFFLQPAKISQVKRMASQGQRMPHKSTYFYPKLLTGLVVNKLNI